MILLKKRGSVLNLWFILIVAIFLMQLLTSPSFANKTTSITYEETLKLMNQERSELNIPLLEPHKDLNRVAQNKAIDMLDKQYFSHVGPNGKTPWDYFRDGNYTYTKAGENLAIDFFTNRNMHQSWMRSPSHKENIIEPNYTDVGIGIITGKFEDRTSTIVVVLFATQNTLKEKNKSIEINKEQKPHEVPLSSQADNILPRAPSFNKKDPEYSFQTFFENLRLLLQKRFGHFKIPFLFHPK